MAKARRRRRRLSMTSLIDVIFLLLLFFMLTSTFSKFAEVELSAAIANAVAAASDIPPVFLKLGAEALSVNGVPSTLTSLSESSLATAKDGTVLLVSMDADVNAQRLTDLLVILRALPALRVNLLGA